jgi:uncharacterized membrane protein
VLDIPCNLAAEETCTRVILPMRPQTKGKYFLFQTTGVSNVVSNAQKSFKTIYGSSLELVFDGQLSMVLVITLVIRLNKYGGTQVAICNEALRRL